MYFRNSYGQILPFNVILILLFTQKDTDFCISIGIDSILRVYRIKHWNINSIMFVFKNSGNCFHIFSIHCLGASIQSQRVLTSSRLKKWNVNECFGWKGVSVAKARSPEIQIFHQVHKPEGACIERYWECFQIPNIFLKGYPKLKPLRRVYAFFF